MSNHTTGTDVPEKIALDGSLYTLAVHRDTPVALNVRVPHHLRQAVRDHAVAIDSTMEAVVHTAVRLYLADRAVAA